ncbi:MAG: 3-methyl-2-oxobutanoate hydroxymethyltransferase [Brevundimonas mediterranea]|jgi:3-methyl-2-oxobutanoate hydroxymethyltransferase|uniref:3-methyl-2-oxobutanoate hydroxymethyltransferase n=1 Tax=Brevundimonas mediterranea TaxID=74329 RepID=A0AB37E343_9CAUL|nr:MULTISPECIES: 3-methyl-2-oxobutanoate hydroxymethyltransferase [Brevundimonas]OGN48201.1 MAG: 3-methyl-2-oxobutanoate hydroxymethyltransferase [Caulobacterales bacterium RIFCSPHIGHO2_12_FULL_68_13]EDX81135.1 3-methyl-2-oxobutanoate hydroxymethyltransferase [Brevundimonas sp. BAL3]MBA4331183.1 3-methyl-2-oxobutanoate hydroxymethyltransferase [Brevundimonas sp.]QIH71562.1 3-methyl-2-oxobutanoate hydroxymethyltransferase [Brevundimonas mediterranea]TAJ52393.1 MAG: 3-methyl-2-oxobutanoate hydro
MSVHTQETIKRVSVPDIAGRKGGEPIVCLTAYDAPMAGLLDPHCDVLLVGDSLGMAVHGLPNTVGVTLEMMILHGQAVVRGSRRALVVVDMPFGSYEGGKEAAYDNCVRVMKETGAQAVKLETSVELAEIVAFLVKRGIPVMGHVGLRPQAILAEGAFKAKGRTDFERDRVMAEARATAEAGAFCIVIEGVAESLAREITESIDVPTIGIGASAACDGQVLVVNDMLGLFDWTPKFVRKYADLRTEIDRAAAAFANDVKTRRFPAEVETYFSKKPASQ